MITHYKIVDAWDEDETIACRELERKVDAEIVKGWQPFGSISIADFKRSQIDDIRYWLITQPMVITT